MDDESGERWWKRGRTREWINRRNESGMLILVEKLRLEDTAAYKEILRMIPKQLTEKLSRTIMCGGQTRKTIIDYHEEFEQAPNE